MKSELIASEAVYGLLGWLSTRKEIIKIGSNEDCAVIADLAKQFCEANNLASPREHWECALSHPVIK